MPPRRVAVPVLISTREDGRRCITVFSQATTCSSSSVITTRRRSRRAVALKLVPDMETWYADGKDLMHVRIYAVVKKGRRVLNVKDAKAFDKLTFIVKGDANIVAVDNGNIASDELHIGKTQLEKTIQRNLFQGSALVILRAGDKPGKIELSVAGEKMKAKKLVLNTK